MQKIQDSTLEICACILKKGTDGKDSLGSSEVNQFCLGYVGRVVLVSVEIALRRTVFVSRLSPTNSSLG